MKIEITTSIRTIERVNMILEHALNQIEDSEALISYFDCNERDIKSIRSFRKSIIKSFLKNENNNKFKMKQIKQELII